MSRKIKATGSRGSWFAEVEGEKLPFVHAPWCSKSGYHDPFVKPGDPTCDEFIETIRKGKFGRCSVCKVRKAARLLG